MSAYETHVPVALKGCSIPGESVSRDIPATNEYVCRFVRFLASTGVVGVRHLLNMKTPRSFEQSGHRPEGLGLRVIAFGFVVTLV
jgi:hypothetical protein